MTTIRLSATAARNKFFDLLNQVALGDTQVIIEKDKKEVATIVPRTTQTDWKGLREALKRTHGILKGYPLDEINPLRKRSAWKDFGTWDKDLLKKPRKKK